MEASEIIELFELPENAVDLRNALAVRINYLINYDMNRLINLLYRLDISEKKLKEKLDSAEDDAAFTITDMILERQQQKHESRLANRKDPNGIPEDERW